MIIHIMLYNLIILILSYGELIIYNINNNHNNEGNNTIQNNVKYVLLFYF